jgi:hypothetical protein
MTSLPEHMWDAKQFGQFLATEPLSVLDQNVFPPDKKEPKKRQDLTIKELAMIVLQCGVKRQQF